MLSNLEILFMFGVIIFSILLGIGLAKCLLAVLRHIGPNLDNEHLYYKNPSTYEMEHKKNKRKRRGRVINWANYYD